MFSARSAAVLGSSNVSTPNTPELYPVSPAPNPAAPKDGRTPLNMYAGSTLSSGQIAFVRLSNLTVTWSAVVSGRLLSMKDSGSPEIDSGKAAARDPRRTQERILAAALKEFSAKGFAGARVDEIARRAAINKRMLYHYFGDKKGLFREVLRRKIAERQAWGVATPDEPSESLPCWFDLAWNDADWVRLLEWEALQFSDKRLIDEEKRREAA